MTLGYDLSQVLNLGICGHWTHIWYGMLGHSLDPFRVQYWILGHSLDPYRVWDTGSLCSLEPYWMWDTGFSWVPDLCLVVYWCKNSIPFKRLTIQTSMLK